MNIKTIKELAKIFQEGSLTALEFQEGESRVRLERSPQGTAGEAPQPPPPAAFPPPAAGQEEDPGMDFNDVSTVVSPMVGVFYAAPGPGQPPYVTVGSQVKKGDVLCIVEAMKLMNEITAETEGRIVDVCAQDGDVVEFGQTLFKII